MFDIGDISLGYLKRQSEIAERDRNESYEHNKMLQERATTFLTQALPALRDDAKGIAMQGISSLFQADPRKLKPKQMEELANSSMSFLWKGLEPPKAAPQTQGVSMQQRGQPGAQMQMPQQGTGPGAMQIPASNAQISMPPTAQQPNFQMQETLQPLAPPQGYRQSAMVSQRELKDQEYRDFMAQKEAELGFHNRQKRGDLELEKEFALDKPDQTMNDVELAYAAAGRDPVKAWELLMQKNKSSQASNLQHITGELDGKPAFGAWQPDTGQIFVNGQNVTGKFIPKDEKTGDPYYPVVAAGQIVHVPRSMMGLSRAEIEQKVRSGQLQAAPRTVFSNEGLPSVAGVQGVSTIPPPTVPTGTQDSLSDVKNALDYYEKDIMPNLSKAKSMLGPIAGRVKVGEAKLAGGYGATPEQIQLMVAMEMAMMSEAFANGGKQLTGTEKAVFYDNRPKPTDTFTAAMTKTQVAANALRRGYANRLSVMPANERRLMSPLPPPGAAGGEDRVPVISPTGQKGTVLRSKLQDALKRGYKQQ